MINDVFKIGYSTRNENKAECALTSKHIASLVLSSYPFPIDIRTQLQFAFMSILITLNVFMELSVLANSAIDLANDIFYYN